MSSRRSIEGDPTLDAREPEFDATLPAPESIEATVGVDAKSYDATVRSEDAATGGPSTLPSVVSGRYRLEHEVGRGGLGRVVAAHDLLLERVVALKELLHDGRDARFRFDREIVITARLQHPSIVPIYDAARGTGGPPFYAMRLVTGRPLADAIEAAQSFEERLALLPNVLAVADAVAYAHAERVVHRDLKPHNVLVGAHGETMVIDWGIAKELDAPAASTRVGAVLGTPAYMAPEQALGLDVDERADVYAIGAMLYHLVAGAGPHEGKTLEDLLGRIRRGEITPLRAREPRVRAELIAIVEKAMARDPKDRYRTAGELADDLRRYTTDQLVNAHRYSVAELVRRWCRRNVVPIVAFVVAAAFAAWSIQSLRRERADAIASARRALELAVAGVRRDVASSLDQADPMLASLATMADRALPLAAVAPRLHDLVVGRPGVANASIGFADGSLRGTFLDDGGAALVQESVVGASGTSRKNYRVTRAGLALAGESITDYDVRVRPHYLLAARTKARVWTPPRIYFTSKSTGITCAEPIYGAGGDLVAVTTVDFDVARLSAFVDHPPLEGARSVVFAGDGSVLAFPGAAGSPAQASVVDVAMKEGRLLRHQDFRDAPLDALVADTTSHHPTDVRVVALAVGGEDYLAAIAPIGGRRAGIDAPLDWYVAAMAPAKSLLGAARARERQTRIVLGVVLLLAVLVSIGSRVLDPRRRARA